jgi:hypothetical protein
MMDKKFSHSGGNNMGLQLQKEGQEKNLSGMS